MSAESHDSPRLDPHKIEYRHLHPGDGSQEKRLGKRSVHSVFPDRHERMRRATVANVTHLPEGGFRHFLRRLLRLQEPPRTNKSQIKDAVAAEEAAIKRALRMFRTAGQRADVERRIRAAEVRSRFYGDQDSLGDVPLGEISNRRKLVAALFASAVGVGGIIALIAELKGYNHPRSGIPPIPHPEPLPPPVPLSK